MARVPGIAKTAHGWRAYIRIQGRLYSRRFPSTTTLAEMKRWRADVLTADEAEHDPERQPTFLEDVARYLEAVRTMPTYDWREKDLGHWVDAVGGTRVRSTITSTELRTVLQGWRATGKAGKPLSESACNHRRTALMHMWHVLDGKAAPNPVRDVPRFREPEPQPRGVSIATIQRVLDAMQPSQTKVRLLVMVTTGLPHATLMQLTPASVDLTAQIVIVPRRRKGHGTKTRALPLTESAVAAFRQMTVWDAWGPFSRDSMRRALRRACQSAGVLYMRPYDLRHSFGTEAYRVSGDIRAVQGLLDHSDPKLTERYTLGAVDQRMRAALSGMTKVAAKVARSKKRR